MDRENKERIIPTKDENDALLHVNHFCRLRQWILPLLLLV